MKLNVSIPEDYCEDAKVAIQDILTELEKDNVVCKVDESAINLLGGYINTYYTAKALVAKDGLVIKHKKTGIIRANPAVGIMHEAGSMMFRLMIKFGMTPESRDRSGREITNDDLSPLEQFVGKKFETR